METMAEKRDVRVDASVVKWWKVRGKLVESSGKMLPIVTKM